MGFKELVKRVTSSTAIWRGASFGLILASLSLWIASTIDLINNSVPWGDATAYFLVGSITTFIIGALIVLLWLIFTPLSLLYKWAFACFLFVVYYFFIPQQTAIGIAFISTWALLSFSLAGGALGFLIGVYGIPRKNEVSTTSFNLFTAIISLLIGLIGIALLIYLLFDNHNEFHPQSLPMENQKKVDEIALPNPSLPGAFAVGAFTYGTGNDLKRPEYNQNAYLKSRSVDGSEFVDGWTGIEGWLRTRHWGFDATQLPLNGRISYPIGDGPFPLVMIVHGNHEMSAPSEQGYEYLASLWASHGFIAVSIDENFLNGSWIDLFDSLEEVPARGWLLLEHLTLWRDWNRQKDHFFYNKVDMDRIALIGHSRGGEAIAVAAALNKLSHYPGNGNIEFDYNFNILALGAIAPVDAQFMPGGRRIALNNIDYFVIHGSHDGDVRSIEGAAQYHRIHFTDKEFHFKAALYVVGANHGQFNTMWGIRDAPLPAISLYDTEKIIPAEQQQQVAKVYLTAFLEASLHNMKGYLPLFRNYCTGLKWLPSTLYINEFDDSTFQNIEVVDGNIDISKTKLKGSHVEGKNLDVWRQSQIVLRDGTPLNLGIMLRWGNHHKHTPEYKIDFPSNSFAITGSSVLTLSIAGASEVAGGQVNPIDFMIELKDSAGTKAAVPLSSYAPLMPAVYANVMKMPFLDPYADAEQVFQTFEFPLKAFKENNPHLDLNSISSINLIFNRSPEGFIILEDISFHD